MLYTPALLREIDATLAVRLFGWQWFRSKARGLCMIQPPERDGWERSPWGWTAFEPLTKPPPAEERFVDWVAGGLRRDANGNIIANGLPHLTTSIAGAWPVAEMCGIGVRPHGFQEGSEPFKRVANGWEAFVLSWGQETLRTVTPTAALAICLTAVKLLEEQCSRPTDG